MRLTDREPDFRNLELVLQKKIPNRPTLFEYFMNDNAYQYVNKGRTYSDDTYGWGKYLMDAYFGLGYDYVQYGASGFYFNSDPNESRSTISLNDGAVIYDRESFNKYVWNEPEDFENDFIDRMAEELPDGAKMILSSGCGGPLEVVIRLVGYDNLCMLCYDDPELVSNIFENVGTRLCRMYKKAVEKKNVGAIISNDDWGFNTQTMLAPDMMRKYVFPWHKKFVEYAHEAGIYAILHSCGYYGEIIDDVIDDMKFDARHSYEDNIVPIEKAYEDLNPRIALVGGIDVDFMVRATPEEIYDRSKKMLECAASRGGYALGTGNSVPEYIPNDHYFAMLKAALED